MRDQELQELESELRRTADDLHRLCDKPAPVNALVAEHRRRQRRRLVRVIAGVVCPLLVVAIAALTGVPPFSDGAAETDTHANKIAGSSGNPGQRETISQQSEPTTNLVQEEPIDSPPVPPADSPASNAAGPILIPIVLAPGQHGGESVITTAIYVPEHTESLNLQDLSPAEQSAVRRVLGLVEHADVQLSL